MGTMKSVGYVPVMTESESLKERDTCET